VLSKESVLKVMQVERKERQATEKTALFESHMRLSDLYSFVLGVVFLQFMRIFDTDGNGQISLTEFNDLLRFCVLMTTVEGSTADEEDDAVKTMNLAKMQVDEVCVMELNKIRTWNSIHVTNNPAMLLAYFCSLQCMRTVA